MAQNYDKYELDNNSGQGFRLALNNILEAAVTQNSGPDSPNTSETSYPYQVWVDTDALPAAAGAVVKIRDAATATSWYSLYKTDANGQPTGAVATGSYSISTNDTSGTGGTTAITVDTSQNVGIGTTSPGATLDSAGDVRLSLTNSQSRTLAFHNTSSNTAFATINYDDTSGGFTFANSYQIAFNTNSSGAGGAASGATESARIDSSGRLLVGTSNAISGSAANDNLQLVNSSGSILSVATSDTTISSGTRIGEIEFWGKPGGTWGKFGGISCFGDATAASGDNPGRLEFYTTSDGASSPTERMRIASSGDILIHKTSSGIGNDGLELSNTGGTNVAVTQSGNGVSAFSVNMRYGVGTQYPFYFYYNGSLVGNINVTSSATAYVTSSDYRLKENVQTLSNAISRLQQLKPSRFNFIIEPDRVVDGFLAHEVQDIVPESICGEKDGVDADGNPVYQGIDQSKLVPLLTAALQEAIAKIETLEAKVAALESA